MGNRYLSVVLSELRKGIDDCKKLQGMLIEFREDLPQVDNQLPKGVQKLVNEAIISAIATSCKVKTLEKEVEEALNNG